MFCCGGKYKLPGPHRLLQNLRPIPARHLSPPPLQISDVDSEALAQLSCYVVVSDDEEEERQVGRLHQPLQQPLPQPQRRHPPHRQSPPPRPSHPPPRLPACLRHLRLPTSHYRPLLSPRPLAASYPPPRSPLALALPRLLRTLYSLITSPLISSRSINL